MRTIYLGSLIFGGGDWDNDIPQQIAIPEINIHQDQNYWWLLAIAVLPVVITWMLNRKKK